MTATHLPDESADLVASRRLGAELVYRYLQTVQPDITVAYDGDRTVSLGPITIHYDTRDVEIHFPHPYLNDHPDLAAHLPGDYPFTAVITVVDGLLSGWQVTP